MTAHTSCLRSDYTNSTFKENKIDIATKTMVKEVQETKILALNEKRELVEYPYGLLVWCVVFWRRFDSDDWTDSMLSTSAGPPETPLVPSLAT